MYGVHLGAGGAVTEIPGPSIAACTGVGEDHRLVLHGRAVGEARDRAFARWYRVALRGCATRFIGDGDLVLACRPDVGGAEGAVVPDVAQVAGTSGGLDGEGAVRAVGAGGGVAGGHAAFDRRWRINAEVRIDLAADADGGDPHGVVARAEFVVDGHAVLHTALGQEDIAGGVRPSDIHRSVGDHHRGSAVGRVGAGCVVGMERQRCSAMQHEAGAVGVIVGIGREAVAGTVGQRGDGACGEVLQAQAAEVVHAGDACADGVGAGHVHVHGHRDGDVGGVGAEEVDGQLLSVRSLRGHLRGPDGMEVHLERVLGVLARGTLVEDESGHITVLVQGAGHGEAHNGPHRLLASAERAAGEVVHFGRLAHRGGNVGAVGLQPETLAAMDRAVRLAIWKAGGIVLKTAGHRVEDRVLGGHVAATGDGLEVDGAGQGVAHEVPAVFTVGA